MSRSTIKIEESIYNIADIIIPPGQTIHVNHAACPAGVDTRGRLYVTRPLDKPNILLAYCHNCGNSGLMTYNSFPIHSYKLEPPNKHESNTDGLSEMHYHEYLDKTYSIDIDNKVFISYIAYNCINYLEHIDIKNFIESNRIYSTFDSFLLPIRTDWNVYEGIVKRLFSPLLYANPYLSKVTNTYFCKPFSPPIRSGYPTTDNKILFIVEDLVSSFLIKALWPRVYTLALLGTNISLSTLHDIILLNPGHINIWLDNDSPTCMHTSIKIRDTLRIMLPQSTVCTLEYGDPKRATAEDIKVIEDYIKLTTP